MGGRQPLTRGYIARFNILRDGSKSRGRIAAIRARGDDIAFRAPGFCQQLPTRGICRQRRLRKAYRPDCNYRFTHAALGLRCQDQDRQLLQGQASQRIDLAQGQTCADCVEKLRNQSVADFLRKPMKRNSRKALTTRQRMAARERM
ncbi:MAG: hypothetical protein GKR99_11890 [Rhodobacteraceae bacterium]|nr:hypothetical protein [Paracoccaceae bacterium]